MANQFNSHEGPVSGLKPIAPKQAPTDLVADATAERLPSGKVVFKAELNAYAHGWLVDTHAIRAESLGDLYTLISNHAQILHVSTVKIETDLTGIWPLSNSAAWTTEEILRREG